MDFLVLYVLGALLSVVGFVLFWGFMVHLIVRLMRSESTMTPAQKMALLAGLMRNRPGGAGPREPGPIESSVRGMAASHGIDLDRPL